MLTYKQFLNETAEEDALQTPQKALQYAKYVIGGEWTHGEDVIAMSPFTAYAYAFRILHGRFLKGEETIMKDPKWTIEYAAHLIHGRWPEAEESLRESEDTLPWWRKYAVEMNSMSTLTDKIAWINNPEKYNMEYTLDILNRTTQMPKLFQELIIQKRPDLIGKIKNLDPSLKAKYQHEDELGQVDL
jgi:hypothetical protein